MKDFTDHCQALLNAKGFTWTELKINDRWENIIFRTTYSDAALQSRVWATLEADDLLRAEWERGFTLVPSSYTYRFIERAYNSLNEDKSWSSMLTAYAIDVVEDCVEHEHCENLMEAYELQIVFTLKKETVAAAVMAVYSDYCAIYELTDITKKKKRKGTEAPQKAQDSEQGPRHLFDD